MLKTVTSNTFCSSANLGSGFDSFGMCLDAFRVSVIVRETVNVKGKLTESIHLNNRSGTTALPEFLARKMCDLTEFEGSYELEIKSTIPMGKGLGSSGAVSVGVVAAMGRYLGMSLTVNDVISIALNGEEFISGSKHGDNVAASALGGFSILHSTDPVLATKILSPKELKFMIIIPEISEKEKTKNNRIIIPDLVKFDDHVANSMCSNAMILGVQSGNRDLIHMGMNDRIVEKARSMKYPFFYDVKTICSKFGAIGTALSGAGPAILSIIDEETNTKSTEVALQSYFSSINLKHQVIYSGIGEGVKID